MGGFLSQREEKSNDRKSMDWTFLSDS